MLFSMLCMEKMVKMELHKVTLKYLKIPYTHSGVVSSHNAMDKIISKEISKKNFNSKIFCD